MDPAHFADLSEPKRQRSHGPWRHFFPHSLLCAYRCECAIGATAKRKGSLRQLTCRIFPTYSVRMTTTDVFGAIANPTRRRILEMLRGGPRAAGEIASAFAVNRPAVSEHLQVLRLAGLVTERASGRQRLYGLNAGKLRELAEWLHPFEQYWEQRLDALTEILDKNTQ